MCGATACGRKRCDQRRLTCLWLGLSRLVGIVGRHTIANVFRMRAVSSHEVAHALRRCAYTSQGLRMRGQGREQHYLEVSVIMNAYYLRNSNPVDVV